MLHVLARLSRALDRWLSRLTLAFAWNALLLLISVTVLNVVGRQFYRGDWATLSELGSDLFFALVMLSFGYAYLRDGHVRIDLFRDRMPVRWVAWIELVGCLAILFPLSWFLIEYGVASAWLSLIQGERSSAVFDLPSQWVIKATVPLGFLLLLLSGVSVVIRNGLFLMGKQGAPAPGGDDGAAVE